VTSCNNTSYSKALKKIVGKMHWEKCNSEKQAMIFASTRLGVNIKEKLVGLFQTKGKGFMDALKFEIWMMM